MKNIEWNRTGKRTKFFKYSIAQTAQALKVTPAAVHKAKQRGTVHPEDPVSYARYILTSKGDQVCQLCGHPLEKKKESQPAVIPIIPTEIPKESEKKSGIPAWLNVESTSNEEKYASPIEKSAEQPERVSTKKEQNRELIHSIWKMNKDIAKAAKQIQDLHYILVPIGGEGDLLTGDIPPEWFPEKDQEEYAIEYNKQNF